MAIINFQMAMLYRHLHQPLYTLLKSQPGIIPIIHGAPHIGKTTLILNVISELFQNVIHLQSEGNESSMRDLRLVQDEDQFSLLIAALAPDKVGSRADTIIYIEDIHRVPNLFPFLDRLAHNPRFRIIASASVMMPEFSKLPSSLALLRMNPLNFEEFLIANGTDNTIIAHLKECGRNRTQPSPGLHNYLLKLHNEFLIYGGLPVLTTVKTEQKFWGIDTPAQNVQEYYGLWIRSCPDLNKDRALALYQHIILKAFAGDDSRLIYRNIENKFNFRNSSYDSAISRFTDNGVLIPVHAVNSLQYPVQSSCDKKLLKLYLNDAAFLKSWIRKITDEDIRNNKIDPSVNILYKTAVAAALYSVGKTLYYCDHRSIGNADFLCVNPDSQSLTAIKVLCGTKSSLTPFRNLIQNATKSGNPLSEAICLTEAGRVEKKDGITFLPIYLSHFLYAS